MCTGEKIGESKLERIQFRKKGQLRPINFMTATPTVQWFSLVQKNWIIRSYKNKRTMEFRFQSGGNYPQWRVRVIGFSLVTSGGGLSWWHPFRRLVSESEQKTWCNKVVDRRGHPRPHHLSNLAQRLRWLLIEFNLFLNNN
jgi:hypothetical protein